MRLKAALYRLAFDGCSFTEGARVGSSDLAKDSSMTVMMLLLHHEITSMSVRDGMKIMSFA